MHRSNLKVFQKTINVLKNKKLRVVLILVIFSIFIINFSHQYINEHIVLDSNQVTLSKCVDGDTAHFYINGKNVKVRFLAIDTPETVKPGTPVQPYGKEASEFTSNALKNAKEIRLEYEESNKIDKYNRTLAYVFVDGELLQEQLLLKGYAKMTCLCNNYRYSSILNAAERKAKENKLGLWGGINDGYITSY